MYIKTENQLKGTKQIVIEMSGTIRQLNKMITFKQKLLDLRRDSTIRNADKKIMRVQDLQQFLSKFTAANKDGSRQGNAISNAVIMVEVNGHLEKVVRMEVQENATPIIGHKGHSAHRLVLKQKN